MCHLRDQGKGDESESSEHSEHQLQLVTNEEIKNVLRMSSTAKLSLFPTPYFFKLVLGFLLKLL
jgi:hypothetical protein